MYTPDSPVMGDTLGSADAWKAYFREVGSNHLDDLDLLTDTVYEFAPHSDIRLAGHIVICQGIHETSADRDGDGEWVPFTSEAWDCRNPSGIGVTNDSQRCWYRFPNGRDAALAWLIRLVWYTQGTIPDVLKPHLDTNPRALPDAVKGNRHTLREFGNADWRTYPTWAAVDDYGQQWADTLNRLSPVFAGDGDNETEDPMSYKTVIPGLPGGPLETSFPIVVDLIPPWRTNNRPGLKLRGAFDTTQHATANWSSNARQEANYLLNGAEGRQASWHATMDEDVCVLTLPVDEVGWHASDGAGPGNMSTVACELTQRSALVNNPVLWRRARRNAAEFMARVAARKGGDSDGSYHRTYAPNRKYCPAVVFNTTNGTEEYQADYDHFYALEKAAMRGETPEPEEPVIIEIGDTLRTLVRLNVRLRPGTDAPVLGTLDIGTEIVVNGRWESADGYGWLPVATPLGDGAVAQGDASGPYLEKIASAEPEEPEYAEVAPIPALLETDLQKYDTVEGITTDDTGHEFVFVADVIEFTSETVAARFAVDENPQAVKAPYAVGERAISAWLVKNQTGTWWYVLTGGDDEWVRVPYRNTRRVSDAPLLPSDNDVE